MSTKFQINDPSLESQWRAIILFGKLGHKFAFFAKRSLLEIIEKEKATISLDELAIPFSKNIVKSYKESVTNRV
jgi:hypothetical protein